MELARTCGQMLASITTVIAKAAVGVFLLRLAIEPWQRRLIWTTLVIFSLISLGKSTVLSISQVQDHELTVCIGTVLVIVGWVGCKPIARAWDNRVPGVCINTAPFQTLWGGKLLGIQCSRGSDFRCSDILFRASGYNSGRLDILRAAVAVHLEDSSATPREGTDRWQLEPGNIVSRYLPLAGVVIGCSAANKGAKQRSRSGYNESGGDQGERVCPQRPSGAIHSNRDIDDTGLHGDSSVHAHVPLVVQIMPGASQNQPRCRKPMAASDSRFHHRRHPHRPDESTSAPEKEKTFFVVEQQLQLLQTHQCDGRNASVEI